jgi:hypothetical protein
MTVSRPDNRVARIFLSEKFIRLKEAHPFTLTCSGECNEQAVKKLACCSRFKRKEYCFLSDVHFQKNSAHGSTGSSVPGGPAPPVEWKVAQASRLLRSERAAPGRVIRNEWRKQRMPIPSLQFVASLHSLLTQFFGHGAEIQ